MSVEKHVPQIRFTGFFEEWVDSDLKSMCDSFSYGLNASAIKFDGINKYLRITDIDEKSRRFCYGSLTSPDADLSKSDGYLLKSGDILFARTGASVGKTYIYNEQDGKVYFAGFLIRASVNNKANAQFIFQNTHTHEYANFVTTTSQRSGQPGINAKEYSEYRLFKPSEKEQTQIGNYFQKLDSLINQHQQKHDKLSSIKKAMLEKMFPKQGETIPEIRFKGFGGEWKESILEKCTDLLTGNPFNSKEFSSEGIFLVRGMNVKRGYLDSSPEISEFWPSSKGLERYLLESEDIVVQMDGALIGKSYAKLKSSNLPAILVQRVTRIRCSQVNPEFIYQYIQKDFLNHISGIKTETAVPHLSLHDIRAFSVFLPERPEQNVIGNYFQKLDTLINQHQQQITKLNNIKQACLSKMFV